jgi:hypothetical protein
MLGHITHIDFWVVVAAFAAGLVTGIGVYTIYKVREKWLRK